MYFNWQRSGLTPGAPFDRTSPNIAAIRAHVLARFGGTNLGTYGVRPITGGTQWSTHAYGAAWDWGYGADNALRLRVIDWLIANHEKLHVQMIVDEGHDRVWKSYRPELGGPGWKNVDIVGWAWLHIETTKDGWGDSTPVEQRLGAPQPPQPPTPDEDDMRTLPTPQRVYDSRKSTLLKAGEVRSVPVLANVVGVNITVVNPGGDGHLVAWGADPAPATSNINFYAGRTVANFAQVATDGGVLRLRASVDCHVIVDLQAAG